MTENEQTDATRFGTEKIQHCPPEPISFRPSRRDSENALGRFSSAFLRSSLCGLMLCGCSDSGNSVAPPPTKTASTPGAPDADSLNSEPSPTSASSSESPTASENAANGSSTGTASDSSSAANGESSAAGGVTAMETYDGMKFSVPAAWKKLPLSAMQQGIIAAKFGIPELGDDISLTLSTSGGS
ncbi:MAG: hypothetical protein ACK50J_25365, partial [Planctomyces sp.]